MALNTDTFISNKWPFFGGSPSHLPDKIQHYKINGWWSQTKCITPSKLWCRVLWCTSHVTLSTWPNRSLDFQDISNPSNTQHSNHDNTPLRGQTGLLQSVTDLSFQMILWKHCKVQQNIANIIIQHFCLTFV